MCELLTFKINLKSRCRPRACRHNKTHLNNTSCYIISRTDTFVCVLPSTVTEGGNKFQQRILAFVLAKAQVTASTGKRGKYNMVAAYWKV